MKTGTHKKPEVSAHALVRFLERHHGVDMDAIRAEMLSEEVRAAVRAGAASITIGGLSFLIAGHVITTAVPPRYRPGRGPMKARLEDAREEWDAEIEGME